MVVASPPRIDLERFQEEGYLAVEDVLDLERDLAPPPVDDQLQVTAHKSTEAEDRQPGRVGYVVRVDGDPLRRPETDRRETRGRVRARLVAVKAYHTPQ